MDGTGILFTGFINALPPDVEAMVVRYPTERVQSSDELVRFLDSSLPDSDPFVLVAESFSTPLAMQWAAKNRANLKGLIICAGFATSPIRDWRRHLCQLLANGPFLPPPDVAIRRYLLGSPASASLVAELKGAIGSVRPPVLANRLQLTLQCDARDALREVSSPVLFVQPAEDKLVNSAAFDEMRAIRPQAFVETISGPHLLLQTRTKESAEIISKYARSFSKS